MKPDYHYLYNHASEIIDNLSIYKQTPYARQLYLNPTQFSLLIPLLKLIANRPSNSDKYKTLYNHASEIIYNLTRYKQYIVAQKLNIPPNKLSTILPLLKVIAEHQPYKDYSTPIQLDPPEPIKFSWITNNE